MNATPDELHRAIEAMHKAGWISGGAAKATEQRQSISINPTLAGKERLRALLILAVELERSSGQRLHRAELGVIWDLAMGNIFQAPADVDAALQWPQELSKSPPSGNRLQGD